LLMVLGLALVAPFCPHGNAQDVAPPPFPPEVQAQPKTEPPAPANAAQLPVNGAPAKPPLPTPKDPSLPSVFLIGDSTVRNGSGHGSGGMWGWGGPLADLLDQTKINVVNRAMDGRSSRTYITEGHWDELLALLKPGDFVVMQFGHNDAGPLDDTARARGTIPGVGNESREIDNPVTGKHEVVHTYGWYLRKYIADTESKGATPIVCSPVPRKAWKDGRIVRFASTYGGWAKEVAAAKKVAFVDLNEIVARRYETLGEAQVELLFADPNTHTTRAGAELNAESVVAGLKALRGNPLEPYLSEKGLAVTADSGR